MESFKDTFPTGTLCIPSASCRYHRSLLERRWKARIGKLHPTQPDWTVVILICFTSLSVQDALPPKCRYCCTDGLFLTEQPCGSYIFQFLPCWCRLVWLAHASLRFHFAFSSSLFRKTGACFLRFKKDMERHFRQDETGWRLERPHVVDHRKLKASVSWLSRTSHARFRAQNPSINSDFPENLYLYILGQTGGT